MAGNVTDFVENSQGFSLLFYDGFSQRNRFGKQQAMLCPAGSARLLVLIRKAPGGVLFLAGQQTGFSFHLRECFPLAQTYVIPVAVLPAGRIQDISGNYDHRDGRLAV